MTALFDTVFGLTILLGFVLGIGAVYKNIDRIMQAFDNLTWWIDKNGLKLLAYVFLLFFGLSILVGLGFI
jgi:hypothetical protein